MTEVDMNLKSKSTADESESPVGVAFDISPEANRVLTSSASRSERAKKREAKLRLEDHLLRFPDWQL